jgi:hypothetical protein
MQKLDNINEDAEETQLSKLNAPRLSVVLPAETEVPGKEDSTPGSPESATRHSGESKRALELSHVTIGTVSEQDENSAPRFKDLEHYESLFDGSDPRSSSQSSRPPLSDLYAEIYAQYNKPKVKLGPRPKPLLDTKRPHTSGDAKPAAKPKSSLPSGLRAAKRKTAEPKRPKSRDSSIVPSIAFPPPPPMPVVPDLPPPSPGYSPTSPASIRSLPAHTYSSLHHGSKGATLEKQRLMKALEKRKKQLQAKKEQEAEVIEATAEHVEDVLPDAAETPEVLIHDSSPAEPLEQGGTEAAITSGGEPSAPHEKVEEDSSSTADIDTTENLPTQVGEEESAEVTTNHLETDDMHSAVSVSSPRSAETQGSECAPSTRPSSMAEDDHQSPEDEQKLEVSETVQQVHEAAGEDEEASADSTPTAVPESPTPAPGVESAPADDVPMNLPQASTSDDVLTSRSKRESLVFMTSSELDDARSSRKSKRESTLFPSPPEIQDLAEGRKQKRESMILSTPTGINFTETTEKNRSVVDLPQLSAETSEAEYLSDDSFMEELQSAKFEEAMPVSVSLSRSPQASIFPRKASFPERSIPTRSPSQMFTPGRLTPEPSSSRKSSGSWLPQSNSDTAVVAKKVNVSSGISQRIQALAEKSNRDSIASVSAVAIPDSSTSIAKRKTPFFATRPSGNSPDGKPIQRLSVAPFAGQLNSMSPDNKFKISRPSTSEKTRQTLYNLQQESEKPESVQVTARIIRDPLVHTNSWTSEKNAPLELRQSDITIDHQKSSRPPSGKQSIAHVDDASPRPSSPSHTKEAATKEAAPVLPRTSSESSWKPFGRRMSESKQQRSQSSHSMESSDEKPDKKEKKESRATKMFKRMSTIPSSSKSRKNSIPTSMLSEEELPATLPSLREPPSPVQIGDLNIQFPDTLVCITNDTYSKLARANIRLAMETKICRDRRFREPCLEPFQSQSSPYLQVVND